MSALRSARAILVALAVGTAAGPAAPAVAQRLTQDDTVDAGSGFLPRTDREIELYGLYADHHVGVVGEEIITRTDVLSFQRTRDFVDPTAGQNGLSEMEVLQLRFEGALSQVMEQRLKIQGGLAQGYDPELVSQASQDQFERYVELYGGPQAATAVFADWQFTPASFREFLEERLVSNLWEDSVTGRSPGPTGRTYVDNNVRPGQLYSRYREYLESQDPRVREKVGKTQGRLSLQFLFVEVDPAHGVDEARRLADAARKNVLDGVVELNELVEQYAPPAYRGDRSRIVDELTEWSAIARPRVFGPEGERMREFLLETPVGGLSPVLPLGNEGVVQAFVLYQVTARSGPTEATPFADLGLQERLREELEEEASTRRVARGLADLVRTTHVSPPNLRQLFLINGSRRLQAR